MNIQTVAETNTLPAQVARVVLVKAPSLRHWRLDRGYTQPELAERAGTTRNTVTRLEAGRDTRPNMVRKLAEALGVRPRDLMREPPPVPTSH